MTLRRVGVGAVALALLAALVVGAAPLGAQASDDSCEFEIPTGYNVIESNDRFIIGTTGSDFICAGHGRNTIRGKGGADIILGRGGNDVIYGGYGNDTISGGAGNDRIIAGGGADYVVGGPGNNVILGGQGHDRLFGGPGRDLITGGRGNDIGNGGDGNDRVVGNQGRDQLVGDTGSDVLWGGIGNDTLRGDGGDDTLIGGDHDDRLEGGTGNDTLRGLGGDDELIGGHDDDVLEGGFGNDLLDSPANRGDDTVRPGPGVDTCRVDAADLDELGCENWWETWFVVNRWDVYEWVVIEHHVAGSADVPAGMVRVGVDNWGFGGDRSLDGESSVQLLVRSEPNGRTIRSFTEPLIEEENEFGTVSNRGFRKQMSAATVRQGRQIEVQSLATDFTRRLEVHLTGAAFDSDTGVVRVTGTPGKEPTVLLRNTRGTIVDTAHLSLDSSGVATVDLQERLGDVHQIDVVRFDGTGDFEIFDSVHVNSSIQLTSGSGEVVLVDVPAGSSSPIAVELIDGTTVIDSRSATAGGSWTVDFGAQATVGRTLRATMPSGITKSLRVGALAVTETSSDEPEMTGTGPAGLAIEVELWDWLRAELADLEPSVESRVSAVVQSDGTWSGSPTLDFRARDPFARGRVFAVDDDGDRIFTPFEGADFLPAE